MRSFSNDFYSLENNKCFGKAIPKSGPELCCWLNSSFYLLLTVPEIFQNYFLKNTICDYDGHSLNDLRLQKNKPSNKYLENFISKKNAQEDIPEIIELFKLLFKSVI